VRAFSSGGDSSLSDTFSIVFDCPAGKAGVTGTQAESFIIYQGITDLKYEIGSVAYPSPANPYCSVLSTEISEMRLNGVTSSDSSLAYFDSSEPEPKHTVYSDSLAS